MPIRFLDLQSRRAQLVAALSGVAAVLSGTNVAPPGRTGVLQPQLAGVTANLQGLFTTAPNRTGQLVSQLGGVSTLAFGTFSAASGNPVPQTNPIVLNTLQVGVAFSVDLDTKWTDPGNLPMTYTLGGALPGGLTQSGARGNIISGVPTVAVTNFQIGITADDGQGVVVPSWNTTGPVL